jgi:hypothetical protein
MISFWGNISFNYGTSKKLASRLVVLILELIDFGDWNQNFRRQDSYCDYIWSHQNFRHQCFDLAVLILELGIFFDQLLSHHQLVYR